MKLQVNKRKVIVIGAMGLLLGAAVIPATVSAAELVTPAASTTKVTNPGNIVKDDNTFYDKYEWYKGNNFVMPGFESGHYTKSTKTNVPYTFEVRNTTDKPVYFAPAEDIMWDNDPVFNTSYQWNRIPDTDFSHNFDSKANGLTDKFKVEPGDSRSVTVPGLFQTNFSEHINGIYLYVYGEGFNKSTSTKGITYRIYQGNERFF